jgi:hypothetical protein
MRFRRVKVQESKIGSCPTIIRPAGKLFGHGRGTEQTLYDLWKFQKAAGLNQEGQRARRLYRAPVAVERLRVEADDQDERRESAQSRRQPCAGTVSGADVVDVEGVVVSFAISSDTTLDEAQHLV